MIDTQAPLALGSSKCFRFSVSILCVINVCLTGGRLLVLDLLSVHLIRRKRGSTIISYHSDKDLLTTTAPYLHERIRFAGDHDSESDSSESLLTPLHFFQDEASIGKVYFNNHQTPHLCF
jgi:hypothetical protein